MRWQRMLATVATCSPLMIGCAADLGEGADGEEDGQGPGDVGGEQIDSAALEEGVVRSVVNATSEEEWVYMSLVDGAQLDVADPKSDGDWDLAFLRFHIKLNGGDSGSAGVEAAIIEEADFEDVDVAPADGYMSDQPDGDDENEDPDYVLREWYAYNVMTHVLTPEQVVYVIHTGDGRHYKLQIEDYYDDAGTSGYPAFRWGPVDAS